MHAFLRSLLHAAAAVLLFSASPANAVVFSLNGTFFVDLVNGADLTGLLSQGDEVSVEAFYDTDLAVGQDGSFSFPAGGAGVRYTVNGLTWEAVGSMGVTVTPVESFVIHPDGTIAATFGGPLWLGGTVETPFGTESGVGKLIIYSPLFPSELIPTTDLPTNLTVAQLAGPNFVHGAVAGAGPNVDYFFKFTSPIPEPATYALLLV